MRFEADRDKVKHSSIAKSMEVSLVPCVAREKRYSMPVSDFIANEEMLFFLTRGMVRVEQCLIKETA